MNVSFDLSVSQFLMAIRVMLTGSKKGFVCPSVKQLLHSLFMIPFLLLERKKRSIESSTILNTINHARLSFCVLFCSFIYKKKLILILFKSQTHIHTSKTKRIGQSCLHLMPIFPIIIELNSHTKWIACGSIPRSSLLEYQSPLGRDESSEAAHSNPSFNAQTIYMLNS